MTSSLPTPTQSKPVTFVSNGQAPDVDSLPTAELVELLRDEYRLVGRFGFAMHGHQRAIADRLERLQAIVDESQKGREGQ